MLEDDGDLDLCRPGRRPPDEATKSLANAAAADSSGGAGDLAHRFGIRPQRSAAGGPEGLHVSDLDPDDGGDRRGSHDPRHFLVLLPICSFHWLGADPDLDVPQGHLGCDLAPFPRDIIR